MPRASATMARTGDAAAVEIRPAKYLYCVIGCPEYREFGNRGIGGSGDLVHTVNHRGLAAVVSDAREEEYESTRRNLMAHMAVLEAVMAAFTCLPMRFNSIASDEAAVRTTLLAARHDDLRTMLAEMEGRTEVGLKVFWYQDAVFREIAAEDGVIRRLRDDLAGRSPEEGHRERIRLGELVEAALVRKRQSEAERILSRLRPLAHRMRLGDLMGERMVLNGAFLVDRRREGEFEDVISALDQQLGARLLFKYVVAVPPYSFVELGLANS